MRRSELMHLKVSDLNLEKNLFKVMGKGGKERLIPIGYQLKLLIEQYLEMRKSISHHEYFIITNKGRKVYPKWIYNTVKRYLSLVTNVERKSPHILRHSFATQLTNHGAELNAVKELLGHSSLSATQVYTHNSIDKLKRAYEHAHPRSKLK